VTRHSAGRPVCRAEQWVEERAAKGGQNAVQARTRKENVVAVFYFLKRFFIASFESEGLEKEGDRVQLIPAGDSFRISISGTGT
jgi:hypothetical protein